MLFMITFRENAAFFLDCRCSFSFYEKFLLKSFAFQVKIIDNLFYVFDIPQAIELRVVSIEVLRIETNGGFRS